MRIFQKACLLLLFVGFTSHPLLAQNQIILDGFFEDWQGNPTVTTINDATGDSPGVDILEMSVTNDEEHLYIRLKLDTFMDFFLSTSPHYFKGSNDDIRQTPWSGGISPQG